MSDYEEQVYVILVTISFVFLFAVASTEAVSKGQGKGKKVNTTKGDKKLQQPEQEVRYNRNHTQSNVHLPHKRLTGLPRDQTLKSNISVRIHWVACES